MAVELWETVKDSITALSPTAYSTFYYVVSEISGSPDLGHHHRFRRRDATSSSAWREAIDGSDCQSRVRSILFLRAGGLGYEGREQSRLEITIRNTCEAYEV